MADDLAKQLRAILEACPQGIAEHALLKRLQADNPSDFPARLFADDLALFRAHFLLFHALYKLRDTLLAEGVGGLQIDPLTIRLLPLDESSSVAISLHDPMRDYYLRLDNLADTTATDVEALLGGFWLRFYAGSRRAEALSVLGLPADSDLVTAQRRYRKLAMAHHPDRGGDAATFQAIQEAIAILRRC